MDKPIRVLVVDDDPADRGLVTRTLKEGLVDVTIEEVDCRERLIEALDAGEPDVIITDYQLRGLTGLEVINLVRERDIDTPIIMLTGTGTEEIAIEAMKQGVADSVIKHLEHIRRLPFTVEHVLQLAEAKRSRRQAEETLRESEERYRKLFEKARDGIFLADAETGEIIDCNRAATELVGRARSELIGQCQTILHPPQDGDVQFSETFEQHRGDEEGKVLETQVITKSGEIREVAIKANRLELSGRQVLLGLFRDISERKQAEEEVNRLLRTIETAKEAMSITSADGMITYANHAMDELFGYKRGELIGQYPSVLNAGPTPEAVTEKIMDSIEKEGYWEGEIHNKRKDGTKFISHAKISALRDGEGKIINFLSTQHDITGRKQAEEELRQSNERMKLILRHSSDGINIAELDPETGKRRLVLCNSQYVRMSGRSREELMSADDLNTSVKTNVSSSNWMERTLRGKHCKGTSSWIRPDGKENTYEWISAPVKTEGKILIVGVDRDITERKRAEEELQKAHDKLEQRVEERTAELSMAGEELRQEIEERKKAEEELRRYDTQLKEMVEERTQELKEANVQLELEITNRRWAEEQLQASLREKEVLLKEIHHRVKNNLQTISSLLDLEAESIQDPRVLKMLEDSQNRVRSIALIHDKLHYNENLATIDIAGYIKRLVDHLFDAHGGQAYAVTPNIQVDDVSLNIDTAIPCGLIICELVSNALKYAFPESEGGEIRIELRAEDNDRLRLSISDNGVGLPPDLDFDNPSSLGLQLVSMLIQQLKGTIELDRSAGTSFNITFAERKNQMERDNDRHTAPRC